MRSKGLLMMKNPYLEPVIHCTILASHYNTFVLKQGELR